MLALTMIALLSSQPPLIAYGVASYYTVASSGAITASGERMRDDELTCAMRGGKYGDVLLVVADNGRSVVVRLNDRGPYVGARVVDLSHAAMRELGGLTRGVLHCRVYRLATGRSPP